MPKMRNVEGAGRSCRGDDPAVGCLWWFGRLDGAGRSADQCTAAGRRPARADASRSAAASATRTIAEQTKVTGLVKTAQQLGRLPVVGRRRDPGPHFSFSWYRGSPIGRERKTEELTRTSVEDINIEGHDGFIAYSDTIPIWASACARSAFSSTTTSSSGRSASPRSRTPTRVQVAKEVTRQSIVNAK